MDCVDMCHLKLFSPHHLVHYAHITLNDLHNLCGDIFIRIVRNGGAVVAVFNKFYCRIDGLEKSLGVDAGENEARLVERLGTLGRGADADCRKGCPTLVKKELSSGRVPESETTANAFI